MMIKKAVAAVASILVKAGLIPSKVILKMDGGICSQMHFYMIGRFIASKHSCPITFDLNWFHKYAKDTDGRFCRNFDLLKIFPKLEFKEEKPGLIKRLYVSSFYRHNKYSEQKSSFSCDSTTSPPKYLDGYFKDCEELYTSWFENLFKINTEVLPEDNQEILNDIKRNSPACAVHVRRGDLSRKHSIYGDPCNEKYFIKSFQKIKEKNPDTSFFIFSDEPTWFRVNVLPHLAEYKVKIIDINGSDQGWCDLILMSQCLFQITSHGTMGKYAAMLRENNKKNGLVIMPNNEISKNWIGRFPVSLIID